MRLLSRKPAWTGLAVSPALVLVAFAGTPLLPASARTRSAVKFAQAAQAPIAAFTSTTVVIHNFCGFVASFNASGSIAPAGTSITQYAWSFGLVSTSPTAFHSFTPGSHYVVLTVTDSDGMSASTPPHLITGRSGCYGR